jgi:hypothetical protein
MNTVTVCGEASYGTETLGEGETGPKVAKRFVGRKPISSVGRRHHHGRSCDRNCRANFWPPFRAMLLIRLLHRVPLNVPVVKTFKMLFQKRIAFQSSTKKTVVAKRLMAVTIRESFG